MARKIPLTLFCCLAFVTSMLVSIERNHKWQYYLTLGWDAVGYYLYLPATVVNGSFENLDTRSQANNPDTWVYGSYPGTNKTYIKYTYGVALTEAPFFIAARTLYKWRHGHAPDNIYSKPDMLAIIMSDAFYLAAGLFILGLILLRHFDIRVVLLTELILWLGTNLFMYSTLMVGFSHLPSFFLMAGFIYLVPLLYEGRKTHHFALAALLLAIIVLIRPTNIVIALYLILYEVYTRQQFRQRVRFLLQHWVPLLWFPLLGFIVWIPQLMYWHYLSGHWFIYSYEDEGFKFWKNPQMLHVLFDPTDGFFIFAPLMLLSMVGVYQLIRRRVYSGLAILVVFVLTDYICGSWWYWTFGAAYGYRPYIDYMPMLAIPMAYFLSGAAQWRMPYRVAGLVAIAFFLFLSLRLQQIYAYPWQGPDWGWDDILRIHKEALFIK